MLSLIRKRMRGQKGFTLIELLVVIIIIAILAAIAIPTFLGQRQKAQDSAAKSIVRNAMTAMESAYVDTRDFTSNTETMLEDIEPSIDFVALAGCASADAATMTADCDSDQVNFNAISADVYELGTESLSTTTFGVIVNKSADETTYSSGNTFYINGAADDW